MHQLVRSAGVAVAVCFGRIRLPLGGMQISVSTRCARMADSLVQRSPASHHWLQNQTQHQQRQKRLAAQDVCPAGVTTFHGRRV